MRVLERLSVEKLNLGESLKLGNWDHHCCGFCVWIIVALHLNKITASPGDMLTAVAN